MRHPAPRVRQPTPHTGWVGALWVGLNNVILCKYRDCFRIFKLLTNMRYSMEHKHTNII